MGGYGWGEVSKNELIKAVRQSVDEGVNFFDTADVYGLGEGEITLGKALISIRHKAVIATKFGVRVEKGKTFYDNSSKWIIKSVEKSLCRLKTDYIDLYQLHYRDTLTPIGEIVDTLDRLKNKGLIRYYGLSNIKKDDVAELEVHKDKFISFQNEFSLACRKNEKDIMSVASALKISPMTWGSLGQGILAGAYDKSIKFDSKDRRSKEIYVNFHGHKLNHNLKIVDRIRKISNETGKSVPSIAIRWILDFIPGSIVIAGIKNRKQFKSNASALGWSLSRKQILELDNISKHKGGVLEQ